jgi:hypothetical protein
MFSYRPRPEGHGDPSFEPIRSTRSTSSGVAQLSPGQWPGRYLRPRFAESGLPSSPEVSRACSRVGRGPRPGSERPGAGDAREPAV